MRRAALGFVLAVSTPWSAAGEPPLAAAPADAVPMQTIVVTGVQPGPGLWKVSKGDHVLWVLGTLSPLPEKMQWRADEVGERIAQSQVLLKSPSFDVKADTGFFGKLALVPSLIGVRNNPDGKKLEDVVPVEDYARWKSLKERYIGRSGKVEKWRPMFAAGELFGAAIRKNGMTGGARLVNERIDEFAKRANIKPTRVTYTLKVEKPRDVVKAFKKSSLDDLDCFEKTLDRIDTDIGAMKQRANAWATGDVDALRTLPYASQYAACMKAIQNVSVIRDAGDIDALVRQAWLDAATKALEANQSTFALLSMDDIVGKSDYLGALRARGYTVQAPDEQQDEPTPDEAPAPQP